MSDSHQLYIERLFPVSPGQLFNAWTDPAQMCRWMGPGNVQCKEAHVDLRVGGKYRIHMVSEEGDHIAVGEYTEIKPDERLQFTWGWEGGEVSDTRVTVTFEQQGEQTRLGLVHQKFATAEAAEKHTQGWHGCLDKLEKYFK